MLLELLRDAENRQLVCNPQHLAFAINEPDVDLVQRIIRDYGLFTLGDDGKLSSPWLEQQMHEYDEKKRAAVEAGRRGAARRYGRQVAESEGTDSVANAVPMGTLSPTNGNIIESNTTNEINTTKSKLLGMSWKGWTGKALFELARKKEPLIDEDSRKIIKSQETKLNAKAGREKYNLEALMDVCDFFKVGVGIFRFLVEYTSYGQIGTVEIRRLLELRNDCRETKFTPKYPAEYLLVKLLEPLQGGTTYSPKGGVQQ